MKACEPFYTEMSSDKVSMRRPLTDELAVVKLVSKGEGYYVPIAQPALALPQKQVHDDAEDG